TGERVETGGVDFDRLEHNPEEAAVFNAAMVELTRLSARSVVEAYDFDGLTRIVDVGGGYGELLAVILAAHPGAQGVLFDLSHAIEMAAPHLQQAGVAERCELVTGSFFDSVPSGGDAYVLKSVIHDWDDERSRVILDNCRRAMGSGARLLLVERIVPDRLEPSSTHQAVARSDLTMLVALGGKERTEAEFDALLNSAGFQLTWVVPAAIGFSVIEAVPAGWD
ncbi:MAG: methyltransferase, partial [Actinomycetota bacterium]|nr:methyltransferase [Actinomycetota bacterium]